MIDTRKLRPSVSEALEGRGLDIDTCEIDADVAFDEYCEWHGLIGWGPVLRRVMRELKEAEQ